MNFNLSHKFLNIIIIPILLIGCNQKKSDNVYAENNLKTTDTFSKMTPYVGKKNPLSAEYIAFKKAYLSNFCNKTWNPSSNISFLVAKNGQIIFEKYQGYANKNDETTIKYDTPIHIASVSKVLTATAILELIAAKKIDLDQKVNTLLKTFPYPEITIKTLLNHRSGMRNYAYFTEDEGVWDRKKILTNQDILNLLSKKNIQLESPTNTRFSYCNTNYAILALVLEKVTGLSYINAMKKMVFEPLGMKNTYVYDYYDHNKTSVPSYKGNNVEIGLDYLDAVYGDKNIYSTPRDLLKFDLARTSDQFLNNDLREAVYKGYSNEKRGTKNYGLGIRMINWETGQNFYFHNGWWHGNTSSFISLINENVTIIALSNKFSRKTYKVRQLAPIFGDYPFKVDKEEIEE